MKTIEEIMGLVQEYADYERQSVRREIESALRELVDCDSNKVKVDKGALQMVLNALDRDSGAGMVSRKEMRDELIASIE